MSRGPVDTLRRPLRDLRISVTDRCNLRCDYCMPAEIFGEGFRFLPRSEVLSFEEIARLVRTFASLGVDKIRITGGEPLLRRDLVDLVRQIRALAPAADLAMTTNAVRLEPLARGLREAGLDRLNISLDALDPAVARTMAGVALDPAVIWRAALAAQAIGLPVKINTVLQRGVNESQILPLARACREAGFVLRFIEFMDVGTRNEWDRAKVVSCREVLDTLGSEFDLEPLAPTYRGEVANRFRDRRTGAELGFINSITQPFCTHCNRARISADGHLYTCLFAEQGTDVKAWLRDKLLTDEELEQRLGRIWRKRDDRYSELRQAERARGIRSKPEMWAIGG